jgi:hypothetical protein
MLNLFSKCRGSYLSATRKTLVAATISVVLMACGGGDADSNAAAAGALACTDTEMMTFSKGAVRSATVEELAGYFRDYVGTFDHAGNNNYVAATATFSSKGEVTVKWTGGEKTYAGTSFCYDTTIGDAASGNTLYVKFANGKVDLWKKNGNFAGWVKSPT